MQNQIERVFSHWNNERNRSADRLIIEDAIQHEWERCRDASLSQQRVYSYIDSGFYSEPLRILWFYFPKEHVLVLKNEYLKNQPKQTMHDICGFLEIHHVDNAEFKNIYSHPYQTKMNDKERKYLRSIFGHEIRVLESFLDWDCSDWLSEYD